jgi:hypothetical protein
MEIVWKKILGPVSPLHVDATTVKAVEGLCPLGSHSDRAAILSLSYEGKIFRGVQDPSVRIQLLQRLNNIDCLIPSFGVMFENLKTLEPCCVILKELIMPDDLLKGKSIEKGLYISYAKDYHPGKLYIQSSEGQRMRQSSESLWRDFRLAYIELWLFCHRYFPYMGILKPRLELSKKKMRQIKYDQSPRFWQMLGRHALDIGFSNERIRALSERDVVGELALSFLLAAQPDDTAKSNEKIDRIKQIVSYQNHATPHTTLGPFPELALSRRKGRPFDQDFKHIQKALFLPNIVGKLDSHRGAITILHVYEDLLNSFFRLKDLSVGSFVL